MLFWQPIPTPVPLIEPTNTFSIPPFIIILLVGVVGLQLLAFIRRRVK